MPDGMARRVANTTFYDRRRDLMQWRVEWLFHAPHAEWMPNDESTDSKTRLKRSPAARAEDAKVDETTILETALRKHLAAGPGNAAARLHELRRFVAVDRERSKKKNTGGSAATGGGSESEKSIAVFFAAEGRPANDPRYHRLNVQKSLRDNLRGKSVLEFPTMHVAVLPEDEKQFALMPEDE
jgi:hypothetical protein